MWLREPAWGPRQALMLLGLGWPWQCLEGLAPLLCPCAHCAHTVTVCGCVPVCGAPALHHAPTQPPLQPWPHAPMSSPCCVAPPPMDPHMPPAASGEKTKLPPAPAHPWPMTPLKSDGMHACTLLQVQLQCYYLHERVHRPLSVLCATWNVGNAVSAVGEGCE